MPAVHETPRCLGGAPGGLLRRVALRLPGDVLAHIVAFVPTPRQSVVSTGARVFRTLGARDFHRVMIAARYVFMTRAEARERWEASPPRAS